MSRLPENSVQAPVFDTPLRRTTPLKAVDMPAEEREPTVAAEAAAEKAEAKPVPEPAKGKQRKARKQAEAMAAAELDRRMTVRIPTAAWEVFETEAHRRKMAGDRTSASEIAREVLVAWAAKLRS